MKNGANTMADYTFWTEIETRTVYSLTTPTNWVEISKVLAALQREAKDDRYDDAVIVTTFDDEIRFTLRPTVQKA